MITRVYTTADFIEAGRLRNGDLYDYSRAVFNGFQNSVILGCKRCGKWVTLKNAASHYMKGCGCKACNRDKLSPCKICGVGVSSKVYHKQAKRCKACCDQAKASRAKRIEEKHGKHCKACGAWFVNRDRFYCSTECRKSVIAKPFEFTCPSCGKESIRDPHKVKNPRRIFCNKECQNAFQKNNYRAYQPNSREKDWVKRSVKAKKRWRFDSRKQRKKESTGHAWWVKCKQGLSRLLWLQGRSDWDRRCSSASNMLKSRGTPAFRLERYTVLDWDKTIRKNRKRLAIDKRTKEELQWAIKINHTIRACKRRLAARSKSDIGSCGMNTMGTRQGLLPFAE